VLDCYENQSAVLTDLTLMQRTLTLRAANVRETCGRQLRALCKGFLGGIF